MTWLSRTIDHVDVAGRAIQPQPAPRPGDDCPASWRLPACQQHTVMEEAAMMPYYSYQLFEAQRPKSAAEQRAADTRSGELAAANSRSLRATTAHIRAMAAVRRQTPSSARPAAASPQRRYKVAE